MNWVVDASVVVKWYIPEVLSSEAVAFLNWMEREGYGMVAPELLIIEVGNSVLKKLLHQELNRTETTQILHELPTLGIHLVPDRDLLSTATVIAIETSTSLYDALYLALAQRTQFSFLTADRQMLRQLKGKAFEKQVVWVGDWAR